MIEEDGVTCLVLQVAREEHLVVLRHAEEQGGQLRRHLALAVVEPRGDRKKRIARFVRHSFGPVLSVLREVEIVDVPTLAEVAVVELEVAREVRGRHMHVVQDIIDVGPAHGTQVVVFDAIQPGLGGRHEGPLSPAACCVRWLSRIDD